MSDSKYGLIIKNQDTLIKTAKIIILGFVSFSLFASAIPFYLGYDDINYGISTINFSEGKLGITNDLEEKSDNPKGGSYYQFVPNSFVKTTKNEAIPKSSIGIFVIGSLFYILGGLFGLFYFGPIFTILLLIIFERFSTKLFGNLVGLLALLFVVGDWQFHFIGLRYLTDNLFTLFFILGIFSIFKFLQKKDERYVLLCSTFFSISTFIRINGLIFFPLEIIVILSSFMIPKISQYVQQNKNYFTIFKKEIFKVSNLKIYLKISFFLLIPWLIFLAFWLSFNLYYFDDITTNYQEQMRSASIDAEDQEIQQSTSVLQVTTEESTNELQRFNLIKYYLTPLIPDPLYFFSVIISGTDLNEWRSDVWIGNITIVILSITLIISFYYKIKRKEILILLLFILGMVGFYSSTIVSSHPLAPNLSEHANNRYMIPVSLLSFILIGFMLVEGWNKYFKNAHSKIKLSIKFIYLFLILSFFSSLIIVMPAIQDFYQTGFHFNNPYESSNSFNNLEKLPEKSLIIGFIGRETLLYTDTHFYPYGLNFVQNKGDTTQIPSAKIETLKQILNEGYTVYSLKNNMNPYDKIFFKFIENEHEIILKDYSKNFCELKLVSKIQEKNVNIESDTICFEDVKNFGKKIWKVTLKSS